MKVNVYVAVEGGGSARRICWYMGTSDPQVEKAIRIQLHLPRGTEFLLRDADGDVVPVSATLPNGKHYTLVVQDEDAGLESTTSSSTSETLNTQITSVNGDELPAMITQEQVTSASSPKRRRFEIEEVAASPITVATASTRRDSTPTRSIATIIAQFVDTFTRPIANDDNVSFIPNAGRFALYKLYCEVVRDKKFHPKREDVFYKMTSMHCKVDRQRVNRYYQCLADNGDRLEVVQCKPQGKGVLLRRYRKAGTVEELEDVVKSVPFVLWLGLDPNEVVALYMRFVDSFVPIAKSDYRAHSHGCQLSEGATTIGQHQASRV